MSTSRDSPSSSSSAPAKRHKPMDRDEEIATLKGLIAEKEATLSSITDKIAILSDKRLALMRVPKADRDAELLKATEEELARADKTEARLSAEIAEHKAELKELNAASTSLSALPTGIYMLLLY